MVKQAACKKNAQYIKDQNGLDNQSVSKLFHW